MYSTALPSSRARDHEWQSPSVASESTMRVAAPSAFAASSSPRSAAGGGDVDMATRAPGGPIATADEQASGLLIPIKLEYNGCCTVLLLRDGGYDTLMREIADSTDLSESVLSNRSRFHLYFTDPAGDNITLHSSKSWHNALLVLGHSDPELLHKQGIKLYLIDAIPPGPPLSVVGSYPSPRSSQDARVDSVTSSLRALVLPEDSAGGMPKLVHPKYKTEECKDFSQGHCGRGARCSFLHTGEDDPAAVEATRRTSTVVRAQVSQLGRYLGLTPPASPQQSMGRGLLYSRPCNFFMTPQGCSKGKDCTFNHDPMQFASDPLLTSPTRAPVSRTWAGGATSGFKSQGGRARSGSIGVGMPTARQTSESFLADEGDYAEVTPTRAREEGGARQPMHTR